VVPLPAKFCTACGRALAPEEGPSAEARPAEPAARAAAADTGAAVALEARLAPPEPKLEPAVAVPAVAPAPREPDALAVAVTVPPPAAPPEVRVKRSTPPPRVAAVRAPIAPVVRPEKARVPEARNRPAAGPSAGPAGAWRRLAAALVDHLLVTLLQGAILAPVAWYWWARALPADAAQVPVLPTALSLAAVPIAIVLGCAYFVYGWGMRGATPGKALLGIVVESEEGTVPIGVSRATARLLGYLLSGALLGIGFLMIAFGGAGLHDRVAGTRVVRRERA
jgi:uncharacterized RDD family membrane protein YckC